MSVFNVVEGTSINDPLTGTTAADYIFADKGNDQLSGGGDNDYLRGYEGDDTLTGGAGADTLSGGEISDMFVLSNAADSSAASRDVIADFQQGIDKIDLSAITSIHALSDLAITSPSGRRVYEWRIKRGSGPLRV